jgi:hypothetical protein
MYNAPHKALSYLLQIQPVWKKTRLVLKKNSALREIVHPYSHLFTLAVLYASQVAQHLI